MFSPDRIRNIFLDRDGTLIEDRHYLCDPEEVALIAGVTGPMKHLFDNGCRFFIVSNQSGIGRGMFSEEAYQHVHARLEGILAEHGIILHDSSFCPHAPDQHCLCRKPGIAMWNQLARTHDLLPHESIMIGDKGSDIHFGHAAGFALSVFVRTGHGESQATKLGLPPLQQDVDVLPAGTPEWPQIQAKSLAHFLSWLVQQKGLVHAHRI